MILDYVTARRIGRLDPPSVPAARKRVELVAVLEVGAGDAGSARASLFECAVEAF
jgi:hypothetical protein